MLKEWEYEKEGYGLRYILRGEQIWITALSGNPIEVEIPKEIEGKRVVGIEKKAFLSKKNLKRIYLPEELEEIGDWAFAFCTRLEEVVFPEKIKGIGKNLFQDCANLSGVKIAGRERQDGVDKLLAAAVTIMETPYLFTPKTVGSEEWYRKWDQRLYAILTEDDKEGYAKQILCGEEDYGSTDLAAFESNKRRKKVRLSLLRLLYPEGLTLQRKEEMEQYVKSHTKGQTSEESWLVILQELWDKNAYVNLFLDLGCVNVDNIDSMIREVGNEQTELKAMLLRYKEGHLFTGDFFDNLSLL